MEGFFRQLLAQLEQFKAAAKEKPESQTDPESSAIVYKFNYRPEQVRLSQTNRLAELEHRLHYLESIIGTSSDKLSRLSQLTSQGEPRFSKCKMIFL